VRVTCAAVPSASTLAAFAVAAFALVALPGPNMIYLVARSVSEGRRAGLLSALGIETGTLVHTFAAAVGLSALLASSATAFSIVKYAGAAYLVYLGVRTLLARGDSHDAAGPAAGGRHVYRQALLTQLLNPKVAVFFLAFLPQFVDPDRPAATQILVLGALLVVIGIVIGAATALAAGTIAQRLRGRRAAGRPWGRWTGGLLYIAVGAYAALSPAHRSAR
jgi:threonine/homoserine/homoserine lactone efflux protein